MLPHSRAMHIEPPRNRQDALAVLSSCSDRVHLLRRQACSSSSPWVRDDSRLVDGGTVRRISDTELRLIPRGTEPLEPLPGVRFESTRVHNFRRSRTPDGVRLCRFVGLNESDRRPFLLSSHDAKRGLGSQHAFLELSAGVDRVREARQEELSLPPPPLTASTQSRERVSSAHGLRSSFIAVGYGRDPDME